MSCLINSAFHLLYLCNVWSTNNHFPSEVPVESPPQSKPPRFTKQTESGEMPRRKHSSDTFNFFSKCFGHSKLPESQDLFEIINLKSD